MTESRSVVVTGVGALCALADRPDALFDALCDGKPAFVQPTVFGADVAPGRVAGEIAGFAPEKYLRPGNIRPLDRTGRLALVGVELALADAGWTLDQRDAQPVGLIVGTMFCGVRTIGEFDRRAQTAGPAYASPLDFSNTVLNAAAGQVAIWQHLRGVNSTIALGPASGVQAIGYGAHLIRTGRADVLVAGGAEELCFESFFGFDRAGLLAPPDGQPGRAVPFDARRAGVVLGEGSAFLVLEAEEAAAARGARILGRVAGAASGYAPGALADSTATFDQALPRTIRQALDRAGLRAGDLGAVSAGASGSPLLDRVEAAGIAAAVGATTAVTAIKSVTGELLGASGALQAIAALQAMQTGRLPGVAGLETIDAAVTLDVAAAPRPIAAAHALVTAITQEGNCAALVLSSR